MRNTLLPALRAVVASLVLPVVVAASVVTASVAAGPTVSAGTAMAAPPAAVAPTPVAGCTRASDGSAGAARPAASSTTTRTTLVGGVSRSYRVHLPAGYSPARRHSLIVAFHSRNQSAGEFAAESQLSGLPAILVYPEGLRGAGGGQSWQGAPYSNPAADDIALTRTILREVRATSCVDSGRVFAVGSSNGAGIVSMLSCALNAEFAAYAVVSGAFYETGERRCGALRPASILSIHGTADPVIHYGGGVRNGGRYRGVDAWLEDRVRVAGCMSVPSDRPVQTGVIRRSWPLCLPVGHEVVHYRIAGGGHRWPGSPIKRRHNISDTLPATDIIWRFFVAHPR